MLLDFVNIILALEKDLSSLSQVWFYVFVRRMSVCVGVNWPTLDEHRIKFEHLNEPILLIVRLVWRGRENAVENAKSDWRTEDTLSQENSLFTRASVKSIQVISKTRPRQVWARRSRDRGKSESKHPWDFYQSESNQDKMRTRLVSVLWALSLRLDLTETDVNQNTDRSGSSLSQNTHHTETSPCQNTHETETPYSSSLANECLSTDRLNWWPVAGGAALIW